MTDFRVGQGYDLHRLVPDKPLLLGGIHVESPVGSDAHSDGDVLLHALIDALLGATAQGDIGDHFPPSDGRWKGADSTMMLRHALDLVNAQGFQPVNVDATVFLEKPKLYPYKQTIRKNLAELLGMPLDCVSFKAKTAERFAPVGTQEALASAVTVLLKR